MTGRTIVVLVGKGVINAFPGENARASAEPRTLDRLRQHAARTAECWRAHLGPSAHVSVLDTWPLKEVVVPRGGARPPVTTPARRAISGAARAGQHRRAAMK